MSRRTTRVDLGAEARMLLAQGLHLGVMRPQVIVRCCESRAMLGDRRHQGGLALCRRGELLTGPRLLRLLREGLQILMPDPYGGTGANDPIARRSPSRA